MLVALLELVSLDTWIFRTVKFRVTRVRRQITALGSRECWLHCLVYPSMQTEYAVLCTGMQTHYTVWCTGMQRGYTVWCTGMQTGYTFWCTGMQTGYTVWCTGMQITPLGIQTRSKFKISISCDSQPTKYSSKRRGYARSEHTIQLTDTSCCISWSRFNSHRPSDTLTCGLCTVLTNKRTQLSLGSKQY